MVACSQLSKKLSLGVASSDDDDDDVDVSDDDDEVEDDGQRLIFLLLDQFQVAIQSVDYFWSQTTKEPFLR